MDRKSIFSVIVVFLCINIAYSQTAQDRMYYIDKYSAIAKQEMERTGVPASIKLAQAILESNGGKSVLSRKANNHFGIKCGGDWNDRSFYRVDDEKDKKGNDIESCFRVYKNPESSFIAHSEFLRNNRRYAELFTLPHDDYRGWAHGLKKAGYATNPKYPSLLIKIVEDYSLFQYDSLFEPGDDATLATTEEDMYFEELARKENEKANRVIKTGKLNDIDVIFAEADETPEIIAAKTDVSLKRIFKYNEALSDPNEVLPHKTTIFLQPKRKSYRGRKKFHKVSEGETIAQISQKYGIRIDKLLSRNRLGIDEEPLAGAILKIKGRKVASNSRIPTSRVGVAGNASKENKPLRQRFATALSDFELPPSIEEEKKNISKKLNFGSNKKDKRQNGPSDRVVRIEKSKTSTSDYLEESKEEGASVYRAPIKSDNYSTSQTSSNAKFKVEETQSGQKNTTEVISRPSINQNTSDLSTATAPTSTVENTFPITTNTTTPSRNTYNPSATSTPSADLKPSSGDITYASSNDTRPSVPSTTSQVVTPQYHTVLKGQTLYRLSKMYGKSVDYIKQVNGLSSNTISIGQKLIVN